MMNYKQKMPMMYGNGGKVENAHSQIDKLTSIDDLAKQIDSSTLNEISHATDIFGNMSLYEANRKDGSKAYMSRDFYGDNTKENREMIKNLLLSQIIQNPNFSDTLSTSGNPSELEMRQQTMKEAGNPFKNFLKMIMGG